jgi:hypothetical protein
MTSPLSRFEGTVKQITPDCLTAQGELLVRVCAPKFLPLTVAEREQLFERQKPRLSPDVKRFYVPARPFRRFSGDFFSDVDDTHRLSAGNYYSICVDESGLDYGTLVAELNAYRSTEADFSCIFLDCLDPDVRPLGVPKSPQPLVLVRQPAALLEAIPSSAPPELVSSIRNAAQSKGPFGMILGITVTQARIEGVVDLRERAAQAWFFERYVPKGPIPTKAVTFLDILPELLQPPLGGSMGSNMRLQAIGADDRCRPPKARRKRADLPLSARRHRC